MKTVNDILFYVEQLNLAEIKKVIENFNTHMSAIGVETRIKNKPPADVAADIAAIVEQCEEQNKRILKRLL